MQPSGLGKIAAAVKQMAGPRPSYKVVLWRLDREVGRGAEDSPGGPRRCRASRSRPTSASACSRRCWNCQRARLRGRQHLRAGAARGHLAQQLLRALPKQGAVPAGRLRRQRRAADAAHGGGARPRRGAARAARGLLRGLFEATVERPAGSAPGVRGGQRRRARGGAALGAGRGASGAGDRAAVRAGARRGHDPRAGRQGGGGGAAQSGLRAGARRAQQTGAARRAGAGAARAGGVDRRLLPLAARGGTATAAAADVAAGGRQAAGRERWSRSQGRARRRYRAGCPAASTTCRAASSSTTSASGSSTRSPTSPPRTATQRSAWRTWPRRRRFRCSTFYSHFESKEEAFIATYEVGHARAVNVCIEAFAAQPTWSRGCTRGWARCWTSSPPSPPTRTWRASRSRSPSRELTERDAPGELLLRGAAGVRDRPGGRARSSPRRALAHRRRGDRRGHLGAAARLRRARAHRAAGGARPTTPPTSRWRRCSAARRRRPWWRPRGGGAS